MGGGAFNENSKFVSSWPSGHGEEKRSRSCYRRWIPRYRRGLVRLYDSIGYRSWLVVVICLFEVNDVVLLGVSTRTSAISRSSK